MPSGKGNFGDHVSVFHFTNRISSAKIRKYKMATERGMSNVPGGGPSSNTPMMGNVVTPAPQVEPAGMGPPGGQISPMGPPPPRLSTEGPASEEPPSKKPRLVIKVRDPAASLSPASAPAGPAPRPTPSPAPPGENITVARPRRGSGLRIRYSENMVLDDPTLKIDDGNESSDLSSAPPTPPQAKDSTPEVEEPVNPEYGHNFMSFYIDGGDEEPKPAAVAKPKKPPKPKQKGAQSKQAAQSQPPQQHPPPPHPQQMMPPPQGFRSLPVPMPMAASANAPAPHSNATSHKPRHNSQTSRPQAHYAPPPAPRNQAPPPPPMPQVLLVDFDDINKDNTPRPLALVGEMVDKLHALSTALTNFGGVPPVPQSPVEQKKEPDPPPRVEKDKVGKTGNKGSEISTKGDVVDNLLGMFGGDDDDESGESDESAESEEEIDDVLMKPITDYTTSTVGQPDGPLSYGIQFIQNALKSWAQQRLQHQFHSALLQQAREWQQHCISRQKRGPGRPRKFPDGHEHERQPPPTQPPPFHVRLESTPEGVAIKSFQQVLDSGCLQVNAMLPTVLTTALRHLYMQIDHLINQGSKPEPRWQCMSYGAQITANRARVAKWKDAQIRVQAEMDRQQHLANQALLRQMGLAPPPPGAPPPMTPEQQRADAQAREIELDRRRSMQLAMQQPQVSANMLTPMQFTNQPPINPPTSHAPSPRPATTAPTSQRHSQPASPALGGANPQGYRSPSNANGSAKPAEKVRMYTSNLTPRSGAAMQFSFPQPHAEAADGTSAAQGPSHGLPNRHTNGTPPQLQESAGASAERVRPSIESGATATTAVVDDAQLGNSTAGMSIHEQNPSNSDAMLVDSEDGGVSVTIKREEPAEIPPPAPATGGFTAVNAQGPPRKKQKMSSNFASPAAPAGDRERTRFLAAPGTDQRSEKKAKAKMMTARKAKSPGHVHDGESNNGGDKGMEIGSAASTAETSGLAAAKFPHPGAVVVDQ